MPRRPAAHTASAARTPSRPIGRLPGWLAGAAAIVALQWPGSASSAELAAPATASAAQPAHDVAPPLPAVPPLRSESLVHLSWRGSVRARAEALRGVRINHDVAQLPAHLDLRHGGADKAGIPIDGRMASADARVRLEPTVHVGDSARIDLQLDGSTLLGASDRIGTFADGWQDGGAGQAPWRGGLQVRRAWATLRLLGLAEVEIGRMGDHFGMGLVRHGGGGLDHDLQTDVDRVRVAAEIAGLRLAAGRAAVSSWPPASAALAAYNVAVGGANAAAGDRLGSGASGLPLQDSADVIRWDFGVSGGAHTDGRGLKWSAALLWQSQDRGLWLESTGASVAQALADPACGVDCALVTHRGLRAYTFQGALDWRATLGGDPLRVEGEVAFQYGSLERSDITAAAQAKTIVAGGGAVRATWQRGRSDLGLDLGAASGEADGGFGVNDTSNFKKGGLPDGDARTLLTGFRFHRSFRVDGLLFRDIIGAVANAAYARPAWRWHAWRPAADRALDLEIGALAAVAASPDATPGRAAWLGVEPEVALHLRWAASQARLRATSLLAGDAFANAGGIGADPAWRIELAWQTGW